MARITKKDASSTSKSTQATKPAAKAKAATTPVPKTTSTLKRASEPQSTKRPVATPASDAKPAAPARKTPVRAKQVTTESTFESPRPSSEEVARRAYFLYLERGGQHGRDVDDWLEAERQTTGTG